MWLGSSGRRSRVPAQFRKPRPTTHRGRLAVPVAVAAWARAAIFVGSVGAGVLLPLAPLDALGHELALVLLMRRSPPGGAVLVTTTLAELRDGGCPKQVREL